MKTSQKIGGAFLLAGLGCCLAAPELMKDGTVLNDWSSAATWGAGLSFVSAFLSAVTGAMSLFKTNRDPLDRGQTERALGSALSKEGVATKADLNALAERLLAEREPGAEAPPVEQLAAALDGLARSGAAAKTEAFALIQQDRTDEGLAQLEAFALRQSEAVGEAAEQTAQTWRQIGVLLRTRNVAKAAEAFERAEAIAPGDRWTLVALSRLYINFLGKPGAAARLLPRLQDAATGTYEKILALETEGSLLYAQSHLTDALDRYEEALALCRTEVEANPDRIRLRRDLSVILNKTGNVLRDQRRLADALERYGESLAICRALVAENPEEPEFQRDLFVVLNKIGDVLRFQGRLDDALDHYEESLTLCRTLLAADSSHPELTRDLSVGLEKTGSILHDQERFADALERYEESLSLCRVLTDHDSSNAERRRDLSVALNRVGDALRGLGRLSEALAHYEESLILCRSLVEDDPSYGTRRRDLSVVLEHIGDIHEAMGRPAEALARYRESLPIAEALATDAPDHAIFRNDLEVTRKRIAILEAKRG